MNLAIIHLHKRHCFTSYDNKWSSLQLTLGSTEEIIDSCPAGEDSTCIKQVEFLNSVQVSRPQKILRCQEGEVPVLPAWPSGQLSLNAYAVIVRTTVQV